MPDAGERWLSFFSDSWVLLVPVCVTSQGWQLQAKAERCESFAHIFECPNSSPLSQKWRELSVGRNKRRRYHLYFYLNSSLFVIESHLWIALTTQMQCASQLGGHWEIITPLVEYHTKSSISHPSEWGWA